MLGGMDGIAGALAGKIGQEKIDEGQFAVRVLISAHQKVTGSQHLQSIFIERDVCTGPIPQLHGKRRERRARGNDLRASPGLQQNRRQSD